MSNFVQGNLRPMSSSLPVKASSSPFIGAGPSMASVLSRLDEMALPEARRRDLRSAIQSLCRLIDKLPADVPANVNWLHVRLRSVHPAKLRISEKRFRNVKSGALAALAVCGCSRERSDWLRPTSPAWQSLLDSVHNKHDRWKLTQLAQFCSSENVDPSDVSDSHLERLLGALRDETFAKKPEAKVAQAARTWNRLRAMDGWPQQLLRAPRRREPWTIQLDRFPASFQQDVAAWLQRLSHADPLDDDAPVRPLRPSTIKHRAFQIQEMASALVHSGTPIQAIGSLADLVELRAVKVGLRYMMARFGGKPTEALHGLAMGLKAIARHHVKVGEHRLGELRTLCQRMSREVDGLREKNRRRLEQLDDDMNLARLIHLPAKLVTLSGRHGVRPHSAALMLQAALAIEILLYAPMRIGNLSSLSIVQHIRRIKVGRDPRLLISIPAAEVKNRKDLNYELNSGVCELMDLYLSRARPLFVQVPSDHIFPTANGSPKRPAHLSQLIKKTILEHTGLEINAHLFRSIAGKIHSVVQPGDYVTLSHAIGDSLRTAMRSYAQFEQKNALRHYQRSVDQVRRSSTKVA